MPAASGIHGREGVNSVRLKSITIHGFKSFGNRTEVPLGTGITGIVGPNGCGKSNVSDAIRWVLGEGNVRNLRGESILDVIFKGAGTTKPSGFAEVNLLIENDDRSLPYDMAEVSIGRRVYRSGESDFLINNASVRLKDIKNLFLGTGLGSNGYSVIERGMVDEVLSDKDEQRRMYFEEAAGISRYKVQRKEAVRKLDGVEQDLTRVDDIVREIEREVRSLARQVGKARKHQRLMEEIRDREVGLALRQYRALSRSRNSAAEERDIWSDRRDALAAQVHTREADVEGSRLRMVERERSLDAAREHREALQREQASSREEVSILSTRVQAWEQNETELARRIEDQGAHMEVLVSRRAALEPEVARLSAERERQQSLVDEATGTLADAENALREARQGSAASAQTQMEHLLVRTKDAKELESLGSMIEQLEVRRASLQVHAEGMGAKAGDLDRRIEALEEEEARLGGRLVELVAQEDLLRGQRAYLDEEREDLRSRREDRARKRASLESRLNLLREQKARHEGFDAAVRHLLEQRGTLTGIHGVVGDLLVPASGLPESTAEALLADTVQWVVAENDDAAHAAMESLRAVGLGGVTFFPLRENEGRFASDAAAWWGDREAIAGPASLRPLIEMILTRARAAGSRDDARHAARTMEPRLRHLSPEGEVYAGEGWIRMTGGSGAGREILERMREIPRLEESLKGILEEEEDLRERLAAREEESAEVQRKLQELEGEEASVSSSHRRTERELSERRVERVLLEEEQERGKAEIALLARQMEDLEGARAGLQGRLGLQDESGREAEQRHRACVAREEECSRVRDGALEELGARRTEAMRVESALREVETARGRDQEEIDRIRMDLERWGAELCTTAQQRADGIERAEHLRRRLDELEGQIVEAERALGARRSERDEEQTRLAVLDVELKDLRHELTSLQEKLHDDSVREVEIRSEIERLCDRIRQEFRVDLAALARQEERIEAVGPAAAAREQDAAAGLAAEPAVDHGADALPEPEGEEDQEDAQDRGAAPKPAADAPFDEAACRAEIEDLRGRLLSLGPVNFLASDEYARQKERLVFHRQQQDDLRKAKADLMQVIQQINDTAGTMFRETFEAARRNFRETFEFLFPGGEADVVLTGDDPLEAGIEITARPRGKKLEFVRLLSTGERSLTAIALLFGLYLVKPSPFCILDELDAPLDDANIGRFVTLLRHFSEKTQFVVITHNKRTMEAADRLYGVTMVEAGMSRIVSVRLAEAEELAPIPAEGEVGHSPTQAGA